MMSIRAWAAVGCLIGACGGGAPHTIAPAPAPVATGVTVAPAAPRPPDPDLHRPPPRRLLDLDWHGVTLATD
ncbi:MAG TPA: hypothetical protein VGC42_13170, partial [Kofleriaceae bacterium]